MRHGERRYRVEGSQFGRMSIWEDLRNVFGRLALALAIEGLPYAQLC